MIKKGLPYMFFKYYYIHRVSVIFSHHKVRYYHIIYIKKTIPISSR